MRYTSGPHESRPITLPPLREAVPEYRNTAGRENLSNYSQRQPTSNDRYSARQLLAPSPLLPSRHPLASSPLIAPRDAYATRDQLASREVLPTINRGASIGRLVSASPENSMRPYPSNGKHQMANEHDMRSEVQLPILSGPPNRSRHSTSSASSGFSDARMSLASSSTCTSVSGANRESPNPHQQHEMPTLDKHRVSNRSSPERRTLPSIFHSNSRTPVASYQPSQHHLNSTNRSASESYQPIDRSYSLAPIEYSPDQNHRHRRARYSNEDSHADHQHGRGERTRNCNLSFQNSDAGEQRHKRRRGNLPKSVTDRLRQWFFDHISHPYPSEDEKQALMSTTGLTMSQISNWFINARRRNLPAMNKQAEAEAELRNKQKVLPRPLPTPESRPNRVD